MIQAAKIIGTKIMLQTSQIIATIKANVSGIKRKSCLNFLFFSFIFIILNTGFYYVFRNTNQFSDSNYELFFKFLIIKFSNILVLYIKNYKKLTQISDVVRPMIIRLIPLFSLFHHYFTFFYNWFNINIYSVNAMNASVSVNPVNILDPLHRENFDDYTIRVGRKVRNQLITEQAIIYRNLDRPTFSILFTRAIANLEPRKPAEHLTIQDVIVIKAMSTIQPYSPEVASLLKGMGNGYPVEERGGNNIGVSRSAFRNKKLIVRELYRTKVQYDANTAAAA